MGFGENKRVTVTGGSEELVRIMIDADMEGLGLKPPGEAKGVWMRNLLGSINGRQP